MSILIENLARQTGLRGADIREILASAPKRYKDYTIPKKDGGWREISQPARELKALQRAFVKLYSPILLVHPCATAYVPRSSILKNALPHAGSGPILKMDLKNFFPSIRVSDWMSYCREKHIFQEEGDLFHSSRLLFWKSKKARILRLAIGAPSSPFISNILMYNFDQRITELCAIDHVVYTRYADDLTFSASRTGYLVNVIKNVKSTIRNLYYPKLEVKEEKTNYATKKYSRRVTGLVLSNDGRVTIGRDKKRQISATVHHFVCGNLSEEDIQILAGNLAQIHSVEPEFIARLGAKYGVDRIEMIRRHVVPHQPSLKKLLS